MRIHRMHSFRLRGVLLAALAVSPAVLHAQAKAADYLRPGDVLRLRIWREPDLSGDFQVDAQGVAVLPRLGPTTVTGVAPDSLQPRLVRAYTEYLNNPSIEIVALRRVSVLGAVMKPGVYPVDPTMTVADVVAAAGGAAPDGKRDRVELRRGGDRLIADLDRSSVLAESPLRSGDQLYVPQRSWFSRNPGLVVGIVGTLASLTIALSR